MKVKIQKIKVIVLVLAVTLAVITFTSDTRFTHSTIASEGGAPTGRTGASGELTCTDTLVPADYDGDGRTDAAVNRGGIWYLRLSSTGNMSVQSFGLGSDVPVPSAFVQ